MRKVAQKIGLVDKPNARKLHQGGGAFSRRDFCVHIAVCGIYLIPANELKT